MSSKLPLVVCVDDDEAAMSRDRKRRERREALRVALEAEYPGISHVDRRPDHVYIVTANPWRDAAELDLVGLTAALEKLSAT